MNNNIKRREAQKATLKFYDWMLKIKNVHLASNDKMNKAYERIYDRFDKIS